MTAPASPPVAGVDAEKIITEAVFFGFEHGQCEAEWEPERAKEIVDRCLRALASPGDGSSADADTYRASGWPVLADRERLAFLIRCSIGECIIGPSQAYNAADFIISEGREEAPPAASRSPGPSECTKHGEADQ